MAQEKNLAAEITRLKQLVKEKDKAITSLQGKLDTSRRKNNVLSSELKKKVNKGLVLQPIKRHKYSELIVSLSVQLYVKLRCGFRGVVKILSVLSNILDWEFPSVPSRNSVENWVKKSGYSIYSELDEPVKEKDSDYAMIVDESMMIGSEKMLLTLGVKAEKTEDIATRHQDVKVLNISVQPSWNSEKIRKDLEKSIEKMKTAPSYIISDNASTITKAVRDSGCVHIRDVGHTLGMFLERIYKNDKEFTAYMKEVSMVRFREIMNPTAYLLPPKQRTVARFLNLSPICEWSAKMLQNFHALSGHEQQVFSFIPRHASFIEELTEVLQCVNQVQGEIKRKGISAQTAQSCRSIIRKHLGFNNGRTIRLIEEISRYLNTESRKIKKEANSWNASSDVIESLFGTYKEKKAPNPLYGVTGFVLVLPLYTRIGSDDPSSRFDFKKSLETVFLNDIQQWERNNLTENLAVKRNKVLKAA